MKNADIVTTGELHRNIVKQDGLAGARKACKSLNGRCSDILQDLLFDVPLLESQEVFLPQETVRIGQW